MKPYLAVGVSKDWSETMSNSASIDGAFELALLSFWISRFCIYREGARDRLYVSLDLAKRDLVIQDCVRKFTS